MMNLELNFNNSTNADVSTKPPIVGYAVLPAGVRVLVACEESQATTIELRKLGFDAWSCDLQDCSGGHPEWHIKGDVLNVLNLAYNVSISTVSNLKPMPQLTEFERAKLIELTELLLSGNVSDNFMVESLKLLADYSNLSSVKQFADRNKLSTQGVLKCRNTFKLAGFNVITDPQ
jgi:hypothetical protein